VEAAIAAGDEAAYRFFEFFTADTLQLAEPSNGSLSS
jgi:hypothetical protein